MTDMFTFMDESIGECYQQEVLRSGRGNVMAGGWCGSRGTMALSWKYM